MKLKLGAIVLLLVVGGAAVVVTLGGLPTATAAASTFLTATAAIQDVRDDVAATGSVASATSWDLAFGAAPVTTGSEASSAAQGDSGTWTVSSVAVAVGDTVTKDQVLATATNADLAAQITAGTNSLTVARLQQQQAKEAYDTAVDDGTTDAVRQTRANWLNAKNQVASSQSALADLKATAARNRLVAPAAGVVTVVAIAKDNDAPSGAAITVASTDYQVTADVIESDISSLKLRQAATVSVAAIGATLDGTVTAIAPAAETESGSGNVVSYAVTVQLARPPATLKAGMTADITITTASATVVLAVPAAAVRGVTGNYSVLVMTASGTTEARPVSVGLMTSSLVEIQSGLSAGDVVVTGTTSSQRSTTGTGGLGGGGGGFNVPGNGTRQFIETKP